MHPDVQTVIDLQQADSHIADLTRKVDAIPSQIQTIEAQLNEFLHAHEERKQRLAANQKERRELDAEIQSIRVKIAKHKDQLYQVKTNEQYKAMLHEIDGEEQNIRNIEDRILEKMVEAEQLEKYVKDAMARLDGEKSRVAGETKRLEAERQAAEQERQQTQERREALATGLDGSVLALYEKVRKARQGLAVVEVRDASCTGCHVRLRPQAYNEVRISNAVMTCETCGRIMYYTEPAPESAEGTDASGEFRGGTRVQMG